MLERNMLIKFTQKLLKVSYPFRISTYNNPEISLVRRQFSDAKDLTQQQSYQSSSPEKYEYKSQEVPRIPECKTKLLKIAILGNPNVGKSTLVNQLVKRTVFACSKKVHTTRSLARAVLNEGDTQIVILDSPGLVTATESQKFQLEGNFKTDAEKCIHEADIIGVLHDVSTRATRDRLGPKVLRILHLYPSKHYILILNKIDLIRNKRNLLKLTDALSNRSVRGQRKEESFKKQEEKSGGLTEMVILKRIENQAGFSGFKEIFMISALDGDGVDDLRNYLLSQAKPRPWIFSSDTFTDKDPKMLIEESVRSHLLDCLPNEMPYKIDVELEYLETTPEETLVAVVLVKCDTPRIERLVKGKEGGRIKEIAMKARQSLANTFLTVARIKLIVTSKNRTEDQKERETLSV
nr:PREDICTED: GTPase Era, mitochondrial [Bemisia tabaci]